MNIANAYRAVRTRISYSEREFRRIWPHVSAIEGFLVSPYQEQWLFNTARELPDRATIVEIGSFKGRSTCCLAYGIRGSSKHIFAIDTFEGNDKDFGRSSSYYDVFLDNLGRNGLSGYVSPLRGWSSEVGKNWNRPIHLLFIDGGHEYEDVLLDFQTFFPFVVPGGLVAFHAVHDFKVDHGLVGFPGVLKVWTEVAAPLLSEHERCATIAAGRKGCS